jgi:hypothetical protein
MKLAGVALVILATSSTCACRGREATSTDPQKVVESATAIRMSGFREGLKVEIAEKRDVTSNTIDDSDGAGNPKATGELNGAMDHTGTTVEFLSGSRAKVSFGNFKFTGDAIAFGEHQELVVKHGLGAAFLGAGSTYVAEKKEGMVIFDRTGDKPARDAGAKDAKTVLDGWSKAAWFIDALPKEVRGGDRVSGLSDAFQRYLWSEHRNDAGEDHSDQVSVEIAVVKEIKDHFVTFELAATVEGEKEMDDQDEVRLWGRLHMGTTWSQGEVAVVPTVKSMKMHFKQDIKILLKIKTDGTQGSVSEDQIAAAWSKPIAANKRAVERRATIKITRSWTSARPSEGQPSP